MKKYLLILVLASIHWNINAQNPAQVISFADRLFDKGEYSGAVHYYQTAMNLDSTNVYLLYKYGLTLKELNQLKKSAHYLQKVAVIDRGIQYPQSAFELAEVYFKMEDYRAADRYYRQALRPYRRDKESEWYHRISKRMQSIDFAKASTATADSLEFFHSPILNTYDSEFSPQMLNDSTLLFSSLRADSLQQTNRIDDKDYYSRIYKSSKTKEGWTKPQLLTATVNIPKWDVANPAFDANSNYLYFSKCDSNAKCEIWRSKLEADSFMLAERLGENINFYGSNNTQAFPSYINGKEVLFFVSDRAMGYGQLDIWYAEKGQEGEFDEAINAGGNINSMDNDISPYYSHRKKELFFSSEWHPGFGGYDIFKSKGIPGKFTEAENLGKGINSSYDDYYYSLGSKEAFFVSDRPQSLEDEYNVCCNDIYYYSVAESSIELLTELEKKKEIIKEVPIAQVIPAKELNIEVLNRYLPVELYFDNDYPDPNSRDTTTNSNFMDLANQYNSKEPTYLSEFSSAFSGTEVENAKEEMQGFFEEEVREGMEKLGFFMPLLVQELKKGSKIQMTIKGYASSLSASEYNLKLTSRRIESLINYLEEYENGLLLPYINKTAENGGELSFSKLAYGDYVSNEAELQGKLKIYSPQAARNRKIEILAVTESAKGRKSLDGSEIVALPKIKLNANSYQLKIKSSEQVAPVFNIKNIGEGSLKIYAVDANCECVSVDYPKSIEPNSEGKMSVKIDSKGMKGKKNIELLLISNAIPNIEKLNIQLLIE